MHVRRPRQARTSGFARQAVGQGRASHHRYARLAPLAVAALIAGAAAALAGCGGTAKPHTAAVVDCGTSRTAANVPIEVHVEKGQVTCSVAMNVESGYASAIKDGKAPGNGGGGPVPVEGWTCEGFDTPQLLKTGEASKCVKAGAEILATLKTPS